MARARGEITGRKPGATADLIKAGDTKKEDEEGEEDEQEGERQGKQEVEQRLRDNNKPPRFINLKQVIEMTGRSKSSIYEDPTFPLPVSFSEPGRAQRHARWLYHEVEEWVQARIAERDAKEVLRREHLLAQRERRLVSRRTTQASRSKAAEA